MLGTIFEWYFDEEDFPRPTKSYIVRRLRLFVLYPIVLFLSVVFLFFVFIYRIVNTYILKRDVSKSMDSIAFSLYHVMMRPNL